METFFALLVLCAGNSPVSGEFPAQRPVTRSFDVFFDLRMSYEIWRKDGRLITWWIETQSRISQCHYGVIRVINWSVVCCPKVRPEWQLTWSPVLDKYKDKRGEPHIYIYIYIYIYKGYSLHLSFYRVASFSFDALNHLYTRIYYFVEPYCNPLFPYIYLHFIEFDLLTRKMNNQDKAI